ncbi:patatin-like phospholipase domain-containing protein [Raphidocelis subcapitata]|uniref:Patatin n=1 Tax=Raphidocelis subcapitata TaxID=307507 RepID=A0A2V0NY69_9CHLO|nr:patatin-like phospholipase domain-containing protein [Raphidocelis subcapitata]|eukprot:GBF89775.1 patatin-like phospholipase domain-containing protein [Raphidocelis subcapitata]
MAMAGRLQGAQLRGLAGRRAGSARAQRVRGCEGPAARRSSTAAAAVPPQQPGGQPPREQQQRSPLAPSSGSGSDADGAGASAALLTRLTASFRRISGSGASSSGSGSSGAGSSPLGSPLASIDPEEAAAASAAAARDAFENGTLGFGFSAGGLLFPYYIGVVQELTELGIIREGTPMAGASAGSLIVACARSGLPMSTILAACYDLADDCRANGTRFRLGPVLERVLRELLPPDVAASVSGRTFVAVTRLLSEEGPLLQPRLVSEFQGKDDLIAALMTSCHIPVYMDGRLATRFRGTFHFDGGITNFLPCPTPASHTVRVCCLPSKQLSALGHIDVSPDVYAPWPYRLGEMLAMAFEPAEQGVLEGLVARGREDSAAWARASGLAALAAAGGAAGGTAAVAGGRAAAVRVVSGGGVVLP